MFFDALEDFNELEDSYDFEIKEQESYDAHLRELENIRRVPSPEAKSPKANKIQSKDIMSSSEYQ